ncbi:MAG: hypothetical protein QW594_02825 [Candidatus Woesearchaeota archaeon]
MANGEFSWQSMFQSLHNWGLTDVLLPFLLVFTIIFAVLQKTKILGKDSKRFNVIISFVLGFMFVMPHIMGIPILGYDPVELINSVLPTVSVLVVAVIMFLILVGVFAADEFQGVSKMYGVVVLFALIAIVYVFGAAAGWWYGWSWLDDILGTDVVAILVMIIVFGLIIGFVVGDEGKTSGQNFLDRFEHWFKK